MTNNWTGTHPKNQFTVVDGTTYCDNCGASASTMKLIKHEQGCEPNTARKQQREHFNKKNQS